MSCLSKANLQITAGVGVPAFSGHPFKNLQILICLYDNLCEIPKDNGRTMAVFVQLS